jgi:hypothetical protein
MIKSGVLRSALLAIFLAVVAIMPCWAQGGDKSVEVEKKAADCVALREKAEAGTQLNGPELARYQKCVNRPQKREFKLDDGMLAHDPIIYKDADGCYKDRRTGAILRCDG